ncbi:CHAP domain-containing protein [Candidatus Ozemobacteraceae bacterium]|nr:CHAP domain-containing protein [Candidatus Ozemobacteraceae bacterium]
MKSRHGISRSLAFLILCLVFAAGISARAFDDSDGFVPDTGTAQTDQQTSTVTTANTSETTAQPAVAAPSNTSVATGFDEGFDKILQAISNFFTTLADLFKSFFDAIGGQTSRAPAREPAGQTSTGGGTTQAATAGGQPVGSTTAPNAVAQKVSDSAAGYASRYTTAGSFRYSPGTENGNLGCADVVSQCLRDAGVGIGRILNVDGVKNALTSLRAPNNWRIAQPPPYQPGDVVVWKAPPGGRHKHIGIVTRNGNSMMAMNNSSSRRHPVLSGIEYRAVECVVRKA